MSFANPCDEERRALLARAKTIAVVGLSPKPDRPSHTVSRALQGLGYRIVPVRPAVCEILGQKAYARLVDIPFPVDLVNVFREPSAIAAVVEDCLAIRAPAIWIQEGIRHEAAAEKARAAGMTVVMGRCILKDYLALSPVRPPLARDALDV